MQDPAMAIPSSEPTAPHHTGAGSKSPHNSVLLSRAAFLALFCYLAWFLLILSGMLVYEGTPVRIKSRQLPLYWFDVVFRTTGSMLLFGLWAVRACAAHFLPRHFDLRVNLVWVPAAIYAGQALIRGIIYQLHVAGYTHALQQWVHADPSHPPHVMSDHILLAAAVHGGLACEALMPLLNWWHIAATGRGGTFLRVYCAVAGSLAALVSAECYFTARYFHPPGEIMSAAVLGFVLFQGPLLLYVARAFQAHLQLQNGAASTDRLRYGAAGRRPNRPKHRSSH